MRSRASWRSSRLERPLAGPALAAPRRPAPRGLEPARSRRRAVAAPGRGSDRGDGRLGGRSRGPLPGRGARRRGDRGAPPVDLRSRGRGRWAPGPPGAGRQRRERRGRLPAHDPPRGRFASEPGGLALLEESDLGGHGRRRGPDVDQGVVPRAPLREEAGRQGPAAPAHRHAQAPGSGHGRPRGARRRLRRRVHPRASGGGPAFEPRGSSWPSRARSTTPCCRAPAPTAGRAPPTSCPASSRRRARLSTRVS